MKRTIEIGPITKVEGHGKITIRLDEDGNVQNAHFHVTEFRGFEKFCEGRMIWDMPVITTRICGICPVSHHLAAAKAADDLLGAKIPPAARKMRELMHMGQIINSHALHFFFLAAPDFLLTPDADPVTRSVIGVYQQNPDLAKKAIRLRKIGQTIIDKVGARPIHPVTAIPGGMSKALRHQDRFHLIQEAKEAVRLSGLAVDTAYALIDSYRDKLPSLGAAPTRHMGMTRGGALELYDGPIVMKDAEGKKIDEFDGRNYLSYIAEHVEDNSWLKFPYYKREGWPDGIYRVGPLARLNVAEAIGTPAAGERMKAFKAIGGAINESLYYHIARTIELLYASERALELLLDDDIVSKDFRIKVDKTAGEGIGAIEAPRGTLIHHYWADDDGKITKANFIVATAHNNKAIDLAVKEVAKTYVKGDQIAEGMLNRVEMAVRCYDPCLSCSTHAIGKMPLAVSVHAVDGTLLRTLRRDG